ncbi:MAG: M23 family metallopeptidase [Verrucomicrobiales bacterium]|nr:M23 family metallopeptidase [Verrucomicrobiales bacterium]
MKKIPYLDIQQHLKEWHHIVLPLFFIIAAVLLILFLVIRTGEKPVVYDWDPESPARVGLLNAGNDAVFDPAFAVPSPIEMVLAPTVDHFDSPVGSRLGALTYNAQPFLTDRHLGDDFNGIGGWNSDLGDPVYAVADGYVLSAGWPGDGWGNVITLLHEIEDGPQIQTFYAHLDTMTVPVGKQVRRGDKIGTIGNANGNYLAHLHFELRTSPSLDVGGGYADEKLGRLSGELALKKWRSRNDDQLVPAPVGTPIEPGAFQLDVDDGEGTPSN